MQREGLSLGPIPRSIDFEAAVGLASLIVGQVSVCVHKAESSRSKLQTHATIYCLSMHLRKTAHSISRGNEWAIKINSFELKSIKSIDSLGAWTLFVARDPQRPCDAISSLQLARPSVSCIDFWVGGHGAIATVAGRPPPERDSYSST